MHNLKNTSDENLALLLREGNHKAFEELYNRYKITLVEHAYKKLGIYEEAKEIVQDIFTQIWDRYTETPALNNVAGWLYVLVRNKVLKRIAHQDVIRRYENSFQGYLLQETRMPDLILREKEMKSLIDREIETLSPKMREVLVLSRYKNMSNKDIANSLNISENTVKNHLKAAIKALKKRLGASLILLF